MLNPFFIIKSSSTRTLLTVHQAIINPLLGALVLKQNTVGATRMVAAVVHAVAGDVDSPVIIAETLEDQDVSGCLGSRQRRGGTYASPKNFPLGRTALGPLDPRIARPWLPTRATRPLQRLGC